MQRLQGETNNIVLLPHPETMKNQALCVDTTVCAVSNVTRRTTKHVDESVICIGLSYHAPSHLIACLSLGNQWK
jgi:hypothetical protein